MTNEPDKRVRGVGIRMSGIREKIKEDLEKIRRERSDLESRLQDLTEKSAKLQRQERGLQAALDYYSHDNATGSDSDASIIPEDFTSLTIAKAAEGVFRANSNKWMTTRDLVEAFLAHNKTTGYNAMDITLKSATKVFERKLEGGRNHFRLRT